MNRFSSRLNFGDAKSLFGLLSVLGGLTGAHLYVKAQGSGYAGPLLVVDHLFDLALVLALFAVCAGVGRFVLGRCGFVFDRPLEALLFSTAIGVGLISTSILVLGLLSGLQASTLGLLLLFYAFLSRNDLRNLPALVVKSLADLRANSNALSLSIFGAVAIFMVSQALAPPLDWDSLMYHLRVPAQFLGKGQIHVPADNLHTAFVQLAHMLYVPLLAFGSTSGPALVSAFFALGLGLAVFGFCLRFLSGPTASRSLSLLWGSTLIILVAITPRVDVTLAAYLFLAHYALLRTLSGSSDQRFFFLAAVLLGFAFGVKYNAVAYGLALSPLILWVAYLRCRTLAATVRPLLFFTLVAIGTALPWLFKNWLLLQAPLYPFFAEARVEPWLVPLYGGQGIGPSVNTEIFEILRQVRAPFNLFDLIMAPGRLAVEEEAEFYYMNPLFLFLPLWGLFLRDKTLNWLIAPAVLYLIILVLPYPATNVRYLTPVVAPLTIVAVHIIGEIFVRIFSGKAATGLFALLTILVLLPTAGTMYIWASQTMAPNYLAGISSREEYLASTQLFSSERAYRDLTSYINRHVPKDGRILMIFEARGYYFNVPVIQDNRLTNWPLFGQKASIQGCGSLHSAGISHVLVNTGALGYYISRGLNTESQYLGWETFPQFAERCLIPVYDRSGFVLYRSANERKVRAIELL